MKAWTVQELVAELQKYPPDTKIKIEDADTYSMIPEFGVYNSGDGSVWFYPCEYSDMKDEKRPLNDVRE